MTDALLLSIGSQTFQEENAQKVFLYLFIQAVPNKKLLGTLWKKKCLEAAQLHLG